MNDPAALDIDGNGSDTYYPDVAACTDEVLERARTTLDPLPANSERSLSPTGWRNPAPSKNTCSNS
jgi:hypothetical protein